LAGCQEAGDAVDLGGLQRFIQGHRRQDGGKAPGKHGFPCPRRTDQQDVVGPRGGYLERALGGPLTPDIREVDRIWNRDRHQIVQIHAGRADRRLAREVGAGLRQGAGPVDLQVPNDPGLGQVVRRQ
jgi:hypothetical protein